MLFREPWKFGARIRNLDVRVLLFPSCSLLSSARQFIRIFDSSLFHPILFSSSSSFFEAISRSRWALERVSNPLLIPKI